MTQRRARSLDQYQSKRDFSHSPEPTGGQPQAGTPRAYCIQKHLASHLHYDFRLEHRGVLLSWAVPKGPSLDPAQKRLAMMVEDHPFDYRSFEGVIPSGYGAGVVMLWDEGLWQPLVADVDAALAKGELKFLIAGSKLRGSWVLIRTSRGGDQRTWLLIKHRDQYASNTSIVDSEPGSVHDGADFAQILARTDPAQWPQPRSGSSDAAHLLESARLKAQARRRLGPQGPGAVWQSGRGSAGPADMASPQASAKRAKRGRSQGHGAHPSARSARPRAKPARTSSRS